VVQLIYAALTPHHPTLLMTLYATGLRGAELARLNVTDIDSDRMIIRIQGGKIRRKRASNKALRLLGSQRALELSQCIARTCLRSLSLHQAIGPHTRPSVQLILENSEPSGLLLP
jgi:integrase